MLVDDISIQSAQKRRKKNSPCLGYIDKQRKEEHERVKYSDPVLIELVRKKSPIQFGADWILVPEAAGRILDDTWHRPRSQLMRSTVRLDQMLWVAKNGVKKLS
jgi:hypothetical protein